MFGQAWNILMGFAGQLSAGPRALCRARRLHRRRTVLPLRRIGPWAGVFAAVAAAVLAGAIVGYLGFRFSLAGVYFALLTIAFSEFTRLAFDHWEWAGGAGGLFLKVDGGTDIVNLRGGPLLFYYVILALAVGAFIPLPRPAREPARPLLARHPRGRRSGNSGRRAGAALQDDRHRDLGGTDGAGGRVERLLLQQSLSRDGLRRRPFDRDHLGADHRRPGHAVRTRRRRRRLGGLGEAFTDLGETLGIPGIKQIFYGLALLVIVMYRPAGVWPWLAGKPRPGGATAVSGARLALAGIGKSFRGLRAVHDVSFSVPAGAIHALIGPNGAGKTTIFNMIAGVFAPDAGTVSLDGKVIFRPAARSRLRRRHRPHLPAREAVQGVERAGRRHRGCPPSQARPRAGA